MLVPALWANLFLRTRQFMQEDAVSDAADAAW
jgi:hypothetical protein